MRKKRIVIPDLVNDELTTLNFNFNHNGSTWPTWSLIVERLTDTFALTDLVQFAKTDWLVMLMPFDDVVLFDLDWLQEEST